MLEMAIFLMITTVILFFMLITKQEQPERRLSISYTKSTFINSTINA